MWGNFNCPFFLKLNLLLSMKEKIKMAFQERYNNQPSIIERSPGRVNVIDEHTDYNDGFVWLI